MRLWGAPGRRRRGAGGPSPVGTHTEPSHREEPQATKSHKASAFPAAAATDCCLPFSFLLQSSLYFFLFFSFFFFLFLFPPF